MTKDPIAQAIRDLYSGRNNPAWDDNHEAAYWYIVDTDRASPGMGLPRLYGRALRLRHREVCKHHAHKEVTP